MVLLALLVGGAPLLGRRLVPVVSGSMGRAVPAHAAVVAEPSPVHDARAGWVILFHAPVAGRPLVMHRVQAVTSHNGRRAFVTKGDANPHPDPWLVEVEGAHVLRVRHVVPVLGAVLSGLPRRELQVTLLVAALLPVLMVAFGVRARNGFDGASRRTRRLLRSRSARTIVRALVASAAGGVLLAAPSAFGMFSATPTAPSATYSTGVLNAPSPLSCGWTDAADVRLSWANTSPTFALGYDVLRSNTSGSGYAPITTTGSASATTADDLAPAPPTTRYYVVRSTHAPSSWTSPNTNEARTTRCADAVTLLAGTGSPGSGGDGGQATSAQVNHPNGASSDAIGNVYFADTNSNRIRRVDAATGVITTVAGGGASTACSYTGAATSVALNRPGEVAVDRVTGDVYVADTNNDCIRKVSGTTVTPVAGGGATTTCNTNGSATTFSLSRPGAVAIGPSGTVFIADTNADCIRKVVGGSLTYVAGAGAGTACSYSGAASGVALNRPAGLAADSGGSLFIADTNANCIRKVAGGNVSPVAGGGANSACSFSGSATALSLTQPGGVAVDGSGNVFVADTNANCIRKVGGGNVAPVLGTGVGSYSGDGGFDRSATVNHPDDVEVTVSGDLVVTDTNDNRVRLVVTP